MHLRGDRGEDVSFDLLIVSLGHLLREFLKSWHDKISTLVFHLALLSFSSACLVSLLNLVELVDYQ